MKTYLTFGSWLKRRRRGLGLTQKELARQAGYAEVTIRKVEADVLRPSREMAEKLADHLQIPPDRQAEFIRFSRDEPGWEEVSLPVQTAELPDGQNFLYSTHVNGARWDPQAVFLHEEANQANAGADPFVAREKEMARLQTFLDAALSGPGQVVFVTGEAGSGKTTLLQAFARRAQEKHPDLRVGIGSCHVYTGAGDPYLPFREVLSMLTGDVETALASGAISRDHALRLWQLLPRAVDALVAYGPDLLGPFVARRALVARSAAHTPGRAAWRGRLESLLTSPRGQTPEQNRLFEEYVDVVRALAIHHPLLLILDDLHWVDVSSIGLLFHLSRHLTDSRILVLGAFRPEEVALAWQERVHPLGSVVSELQRTYGDIQISLDQAKRAEGRYFVDALLDAEPNQLDEYFRQALFQRGRGHPLFTIELLHDLQERGHLRRDEQGRWQAGSWLAWDALPVKVEGVIAKRIDRLPAQLQEVLTIASVEGEFFTAEVVAQVAGMDARTLVRLLSGELQNQHRLVRAQGVDRVGNHRLSRYRFGHNLFQTYLYERLDAVTRAHLHEAVGIALETLYQDQEDRNLVVGALAYHFQEAGIWKKAIDYRLLAGRLATQISANDEAIAHLAEGLDLLAHLPETPQRSRQELTLQTALGVPLMTANGFASARVEQVAQRACDLAQTLDDLPQLFQALYGLWGFRLIRAELEETHAIGKRLMELAHTTQDTDLLLEAHRALGVTLYHLADFQAAQSAVEAGIALYDLKAHHHHPFLYGRDPAVSCYNYLIHSLWMLGYPDQALAKIHEFLHLSREIEHPYSVAYALEYGVTIGYQLRREVAEARRWVEEGLDIARRHGFAFVTAHGMIIRGWAIAQQEDPQAGLAEMHRGLEAWYATGARAHLPYFSCLLADVHMQLGDVDTALSVVTDGLASAASTQEQYAEAELYRLRGELLHNRNIPDAAADAFTTALAVARQQGARSLELRAAASFARLRQHQGRHLEAREMLAPIYHWFSEGFDTPDLVEAQSLLNGLDD